MLRRMSSSGTSSGAARRSNCARPIVTAWRLSLQCEPMVTSQRQPSVAVVHWTSISDMASTVPRRISRT